MNPGAAYAQSVSMMQTPQLESAKTELVNRLRGLKKQFDESPEHSVDMSLVDNYKWQLNVIKSELGRRNTKKSAAQKLTPERMNAIEGDMPNQDSFGQKLKTKTVDELDNAINRLKQAVESNNLNDEQKNAKQHKIDEIQNEINSRENQSTSKGTQKDLADEASSLLNKNLLKGVAIGAGLGAAIAYLTNGKYVMLILTGAAVGGGYVYLTSKKSTPPQQAGNAPSVQPTSNTNTTPSTDQTQTTNNDQTQTADQTTPQ